MKEEQENAARKSKFVVSAINMPLWNSLFAHNSNKGSVSLQQK